MAGIHPFPVLVVIHQGDRESHAVPGLSLRPVDHLQQIATLDVMSRRPPGGAVL